MGYCLPTYHPDDRGRPAIYANFAIKAPERVPRCDSNRLFPCDTDVERGVWS